MQKHPLLTVKQAAELLRLDERSVRERLINGQLKGEKKSVGLREKWFVFSGSVQQALEKQQGGFVGDPIGLTDVSVEGETVDATFADAGEPPAAADDSDEDWVEANRARVKLLAEELVKPMMEKLEAQTEVIVEQRRQIAEQERQLRLLPDLQRQSEERAKEAELKHVEAEALKKQVQALESRQAEHEALKKQVDVLQHELVAARKPWWQKMFGKTEA
jgi:septal ring factor EnvC (AmiA/AmiB activator)